MRTQCSRPSPAAAATAARLRNTRCVWPSMPSASCMLAGSRPIWPERYTVLPARTACEYVPIASGASRVWIAVFMAGYLSRMISSLEKLLGTARDGALLRYSLGLEYAKAGDAARAAQYLRDAVDRDPLYSAAWKALGRALVDAGKNDEARAAYARGIEAARQKGDRQAEKEMTVFMKRLENDARGPAKDPR